MRRLVSLLAVALVARNESFGPSDVPPPLHASAALSPVRIDLGTLGGTSSFASDINNSGSVVGYSQITSGTFHAFLWNSQSGMLDLGTLPGDVASFANAIDDLGNIIGISFSTAGDITPVIWPLGGSAQPLGIQPLPGVTGMTPLDLNSSGQIVGFGIGTDQVGWFWSPQTGTVDLRQEIPSCLENSPTSINASGTVVGSYCVPSFGNLHGFIWSYGVAFQDIGIPGNRVNEGIVQATAINNAGVIAGSGGPSDFSSLRALIRKGSRFTLLPVFSPTAPFGVAEDINDKELVVGSSYKLQFDAIQAAFWNSALQITNLNGTDPNVSIAFAINNAGMIAGWSSLNGGGQNHATVWAPPGAGVSRRMAHPTEIMPVRYPLSSNPESCLQSGRPLASKAALTQCILSKLP